MNNDNLTSGGKVISKPEIRHWRTLALSAQSSDSTFIDVVIVTVSFGVCFGVIQKFLTTNLIFLNL